MSELKQKLTELIEAFAVAKSTGNQLLTQSAAGGLIQFLEGVEIIKPEPEPEAQPEETDGGQE
jgi:hypothetical protein